MKKQKGKHPAAKKPAVKPARPVIIPWILLALALILIIFVRVRLISFPFERDEGEYALFGQMILSGIPPYEAAYNLKLPGTYYSYALIMMFFGQSVEAVRAGLLLFNMGTIMLLFFSVRRCYNPFVASVTALTAAILSLSWSFMAPQAHATHFVTFWAVLGFWLLIRAGDTGKYHWYLLSGLSFGLSFLMKQSGVFFPVFGFIAAGIQWYYSPSRTARRIAGILGIYSAGAILPVLLTGLVMYASGVWDQFAFWTLEYPSAYGSRVSLSDAPETFLYNFNMVFRYVNLLWISGAAGLVALFLFPAKKPVRLIVLLFLIFSVANTLPGFYFRAHYFIPVIPVLALLTAILAGYLNHLIRKRTAASELITTLLVILLMIPVLHRNREVFFTETANRLCEFYYSGNPFAASVPISRVIREQTDPGDRIFVFGSEPQIYFYSRRQPSTGYIYMYDLVFDQPYAIRMQQEMMKEVDSIPPRIIVFASSPYSWLSMPGLTDTLFSWFNRYLSVNRYEFIGIADIISPTETNFAWGRECISYKPVSDNTLRIFRRAE